MERDRDVQRAVGYNPGFKRVSNVLPPGFGAEGAEALSEAWNQARRAHTTAAFTRFKTRCVSGRWHQGNSCAGVLPAVPNSKRALRGIRNCDKLLAAELMRLIIDSMSIRLDVFRAGRPISRMRLAVHLRSGASTSLRSLGPHTATSCQ